MYVLDKHIGMTNLKKKINKKLGWRTNVCYVYVMSGSATDGSSSLKYEHQQLGFMFIFLS